MKRMNLNKAIEELDIPKQDKLVYLDIWGKNPAKQNTDSYFKNHEKLDDQEGVIRKIDGKDDRRILDKMAEKAYHGVLVFRSSYECYRWFIRFMETAEKNRQETIKWSPGGINEHGKRTKESEYEIHREDLFKQEPRIWVRYMVMGSTRADEHLQEKGSTQFQILRGKIYDVNTYSDVIVLPSNPDLDLGSNKLAQELFRLGQTPS